MSNLFRTIAAAIFGPARTRKVPQSPRRVHLGLEVLEGRTLPSVSPILSVAVQTPIVQMAHQPVVVDVPNLQGYSFHLISSNGKPAHDLVIQRETYNVDGSASFTGTWSGDGPNSKAINGTLKFDANGNIVLSFSWTNGSGGQNNFSGTLTRVNTSPITASAYSGRYYLEGDVMSSTGGGPGHISGYSQAPLPLVKANF
ncbi:MAG TPA: hypothetical protein VMF69_03605 [Gemmataceae bacterium]|nr:hypothetical protein [Gemmataceae bacterium]